MADDTRTLKCYCGGNATRELRDMPGRIGCELITVPDIPVFVCATCGESFMDGPASLMFAKRVQEDADAREVYRRFSERMGGARKRR